MVKKCLEGKFCNKFTEINVEVDHKFTRNRNLLLKVPKIMLEFVKHDFYFQTIRLFNSLRIRIRQIKACEELVKEFTDYEL